MQQYRFKVSFEDGSEKEARVDQRDIRRWESEVGKSWLTEDMTITAATRVAFYGLSRAGEFPGDWDAFDKVAVWVEEVPDEPARPTRKRRTAGS